MKRKLAMILAVAMLLCLVLPQMAMAAPAGTYTLTVSVKDDANPQKVVTATSGTGSEITPLATAVSMMISTKRSEIESTFAGAGLSAIFDAGLEAINGTDAEWENYVNTHVTSDSNGFQKIIKNKNATYADLEANVDYTLTYAGYTVTVTLKPYTAPSGGGSTGGSTSGSNEETIQNPDGSVTTIVTDEKTGTVTETTEDTNGVTGTTVTDKDGNITDITVDIPDNAVEEAAKADETITLPVQVPVVDNSEDAPAVNITLPQGVDSVKVELPVEESKPGLVAVIVDEDGNETIVPKSAVTDEGVKLELTGSASIKIIDNSKDFEDMPADHWANDAVDFMSAREVIEGTSDTTFSPEAPTSRGMLVTLLHRLESKPESSVEKAFDDVDNDAYYADGARWAVENNIVEGYDDGSFQPDKDISRQEMVVMLYRYAGLPAVDENTKLDFTDADQTQDYALNAMRWAVANDVIHGKDNGILDPQGVATRAEVAQLLQNYCNSILAD